MSGGHVPAIARCERALLLRRLPGRLCVDPSCRGLGGQLRDLSGWLLRDGHGPDWVPAMPGRVVLEARWHRMHRLPAWHVQPVRGRVVGELVHQVPGRDVLG